MPAASVILWTWASATCLFGAFVGACELIGRYRDDPLKAIASPAAIIYIIINALASFSAYVLIVRLDWDFAAPAADVPLVQAGVASFGAMAFFRSSLFNIKSGDTDIAIGPGILFQILTFATDRAVDRNRGRDRSKHIVGIMSGVSFDLAKEVLPNFCFELMQNVARDERSGLLQAVSTLAATSATEANDPIKALNLGLMLMNVVGKEVLQTAVNTLGERIQGPSKIEIEVIDSLKGVQFKKAFPVLVECCFIMSRYGSTADQKDRKEAVMAEGRALEADKNLDNEAKVTMLALALKPRVGDAVLLAALAQLNPSIYVVSTDKLQSEVDPDSAPAVLAVAVSNTNQPFAGSASQSHP